MIVAPLLAAAPVATCAAVEVHDGDSIRCDGERIRFSDIDAPELPGSPRCDPRHFRTGNSPSWCDYGLGARSRDALRAFIAKGAATTHRLGTGHYGRTLATVSVNGRDAGGYLVGLGLARVWVK
jgi:endonuclease YncB( thermonuclease family)